MLIGHLCGHPGASSYGTGRPLTCCPALSARLARPGTGPAEAAGEPQYDDLERRLAELPAITVPTITVEGDANGAPHPDPSAYASKFSGKYAHRTISGGVGRGG